MNRFGLLGKTLKHSFSKAYFTEKFHLLGLADYQYDNFELPSIEALPDLLNNIPDLRGFNITIPYKEDVLPFLHQTDPVVSEIRACNCVRIDAGRLTGFNTDVTGFRQSLEPQLQSHHRAALVLGSGGASKAVRAALDQLRIPFLLVSRRAGEGQITYGQLDEARMNSYPLIINTSPVGMFPHVEEAPPLPYAYITQRHFLFDLIYNPEQTRFLAEGAQRGARTANGYKMLVLQAEESWRIWNA